MRRILRRLADLPPNHRLLLPQLAVGVLAIELAVACLSLARVIRGIVWVATRPWLAPLPFGHRRESPERLASLVGAVAGVIHGRGSCLSRSLALFWLLRAQRQNAHMLIGVRKDDRVLQSHAWVELAGRTVGENREQVGRFVPLLRY
jgi:hypothetical protein